MLSKENASIRKEADSVRLQLESLIKENRQLRLEQQMGPSRPGLQNVGMSGIMYNNNNNSSNSNSNNHHEVSVCQGPMRSDLSGLASQQQNVLGLGWMHGGQMQAGLNQLSGVNQRDQFGGPGRDVFLLNEMANNFVPQLQGLQSINEQFGSSRGHYGQQSVPRSNAETDVMLAEQRMYIREFSRKYDPAHQGPPL
jgi:hypothetical protein